MQFILLTFTLAAFLITSLVPGYSYAQEWLVLPRPGVLVRLSPAIDPPMLKGIKVDRDNPLYFNFILDRGNQTLSSMDKEQQLKNESTKLVKYFLASLTTPEKDIWVNLSPYEKGRIIPKSFGLSEMGRDLLAQDYMLKQITASLIYPEDKIGKVFWKRVYEESLKRFGTTNISINTFNKVWIVPNKAVVYENSKAGTAYVVESTLKVMLEEDYLAMDKNVCRGDACHRPQDGRTQGPPLRTINTIGSQITREIVIPELTKEVNQGQNFAQLRQVYNSLILATWYKKKIKDSILNQVYSDKNKTSSLTPYPLTLNPQQIYHRYIQAFKKGAYNYIKERDMANGISGPKKYFSGGAVLRVSEAMVTTNSIASLKKVALGLAFVLGVSLTPLQAQTSQVSTGEPKAIIEKNSLVVSLRSTLKEMENNDKNSKDVTSYVAAIQKNLLILFEKDFEAGIRIADEVFSFYRLSNHIRAQNTLVNEIKAIPGFEDKLITAISEVDSNIIEFLKEMNYPMSPRLVDALLAKSNNPYSSYGLQLMLGMIKDSDYRFMDVYNALYDHSRLRPEIFILKDLMRRLPKNDRRLPVLVEELITYYATHEFDGISGILELTKEKSSDKKEILEELLRQMKILKDFDKKMSFIVRILIVTRGDSESFIRAAVISTLKEMMSNPEITLPQKLRILEVLNTGGLDDIVGFTEQSLSVYSMNDKEFMQTLWQKGAGISEKFWEKIIKKVAFEELDGIIRKFLFLKLDQDALSKLKEKIDHLTYLKYDKGVIKGQSDFTISRANKSWAEVLETIAHEIMHNIIAINSYRFDEFIAELLALAYFDGKSEEINSRIQKALDEEDLNRRWGYAELGYIQSALGNKNWSDILKYAYEAALPVQLPYQQGLGRRSPEEIITRIFAVLGYLPSSILSKTLEGTSNGKVIYVLPPKPKVPVPPVRRPAASTKPIALKDPQILAKFTFKHGGDSGFVFITPSGGVLSTSIFKPTDGYGGIDLNADKLNVQIQDGEGKIKFNINPVLFDQMRNVSGFVPRVIDFYLTMNIIDFLLGQ